MKRIDVMKVPFDAITMEAALERAKGFLQQEGVKKIYTPNPEIVMLAQENPQLLKALEAADLVVADGIGIVVASKMKGLGINVRVAGIDLMDMILRYCGDEGKSFYILGGKPEVTPLACKSIEAKYRGIKIAGFHHGYFTEGDEEAILEEINSSGADALFVCLGAPKQELWIDKYKDRLKCRIAMGVGGSVDIYAGTAKRAPVIYQRMGLEWFYRLVKEPKRFKRMLVLPKFLVHFIAKG